jgi:hypothetical protein
MPKRPQRHLRPRPRPGWWGGVGRGAAGMLSTVTRGPNPPDTNGFETGDRVLAAHDIGGMFRPRVPRGSAGIIIELTGHGRLIVHFTGKHRVIVDTDDVTIAPP